MVFVQGLSKCYVQHWTWKCARKPFCIRAKTRWEVKRGTKAENSSKKILLDPPLGLSARLLLELRNLNQGPWAGTWGGKERKMLPPQWGPKWLHLSWNLLVFPRPLWYQVHKVWSTKSSGLHLSGIFKHKGLHMSLQSLYLNYITSCWNSNRYIWYAK